MPTGRPGVGRAAPGGPAVALLLVALLVVVAVLVSVAVHDRPAPPVAVPAAPPGSARPAAGVFRETAPDRVAEFEQWLGRDVAVVVDFPARATWQDVADPRYLLDRWRGTGYRLVLGVALLPEDDPSATVARGARGEYDHYFAELGRRLVSTGHQDAILRLGWEFNLGGRWSTPDARAFVAYWRSVAHALRSVPGQRFLLDWNVNNGSGSTYDAPDYYPGDDVVDVVGVDVYDVTGAPGTYPYPGRCDDDCRSERQTRAWDEHIFGGERGLAFWSRFAASHGKPMSLPEWGLWDRPDGTGGGDDPMFVRRIHAFVTDPRNNVLYQAYFEFDGDDGTHRLMTTFPRGGAVYRELFGGA